MYLIDFLTTRTRSRMVQNIFFTIKLISNMSQTRLGSVMKIIQILILMTDTVGNVQSCTLVKRYLWYVLLYSYINIGRNLYNLIKHLYCNSTCSVKLGENKIRSFLCSGGVRQGFILSPLLFITNFYNNLPYLFQNTLPDPFVFS